MIYQLEKWETHRWERDDGRYYVAVIEQDLIGTWVISRFWGTIGQSDGRLLKTSLDCYADALIKLESVKTNQIKKNYNYKEQGRV